MSLDKSFKESRYFLLSKNVYFTGEKQGYGCLTIKWTISMFAQMHVSKTNVDGQHDFLQLRQHNF